MKKIGAHMNLRVLLVNMIQALLFLMLWFLFDLLVENMMISFLLALICLNLIVYLASTSFVGYYQKGNELFGAGKYGESIEQYRKSYEFFAKYTWLDRYRSVLLFLDDEETLRERSLHSMAVAYVELGEIEKAKETLCHTLGKFPNCESAQFYLDLISAVEENACAEK